MHPVDEPFLKILQQPGARLNRGCHLLSAQSDANGIEARMQFFAGPQVEDEYQGARVELIAV